MNGRNEEAGKKSARKRSSRVKSKVPKPGEQGYLTATQLRNARKRRAKKEKRKHSGAVQTSATNDVDPSCKFLKNPMGAPVVQQAKAFFNRVLLERKFPVHMGATNGWRTVAKLAVRPDPDTNQVSIGLFAPGSHRLIPVPNCKAHHPSINIAVGTLLRLCRELGVMPFDDETGSGHLRHVAINVERDTGKAQITLVWNSEPYPDNENGEEGKQSLDLLTKAIVAKGQSRKRRRGKAHQAEKGTPFLLHSLWVHFNSSWKHDNAIFSHTAGPNCWKLVSGERYIREQLKLDNDLPNPPMLCFPPNVFRQANLDQFTGIVRAIRRRVKTFTKLQTNKQINCLELYGGVGTIGLNVADLVSSLTSSDENPYNKECFDLSAASHIRGKASYVSKNATSMVNSGALKNADVVIVDPPRKGLEPEVVQALAGEHRPKLLVYVSCGFRAFQRDCESLSSSRW
eukprot:CAMPEP_0194041220 /NCGR_PEP_ID=MMETSP0009_2-20130614/13115_1 /TAXON_ID=210454 /ORGANISM="Grammatophora oceanica, Strain CCMP 410" /LENGTH=455 /DNA_ID=CAMNT_0038684621 /DNA_START=41 /DNA_END=1405 /DNA_ORIENTATION=+